MTIKIDHRDGIAVLTLGSDENRFSPEWLETVNALLDGVEQEAKGLVTTAEGKFYSNGLDLEWLLAHGDQVYWYVGQAQALFARVLTFPLPTAAAVNGYAFGAATMLAIVHDYRVMRADRGYYCFPEVDINIPFTPGMAALIQSKLTPQAALVAMTTGRRHSGHDAAFEILAPLGGKDRGTLAAIKSTMYANVTAALRRGRE